MTRNNYRSSMISAPSECSAWQMPTVGADFKRPDKQNNSQNELNRIKEEAYQQAYQAGLQQAEGEITRLRSDLQSAIDVFNKPLSLVSDELQQLLVECISVITQQCLQRELTVTPEQILKIIHNILPMLHDEETKTVIYLNDSDCELVQQAIRQGEMNVANVVVESDKSLNRGECRLQNVVSHVDATVAKRIENACNDNLLN